MGLSPLPAWLTHAASPGASHPPTAVSRCPADAGPGPPGPGPDGETLGTPAPSLSPLGGEEGPCPASIRRPPPPPTFPSVLLYLSPLLGSWRQIPGRDSLQGWAARSPRSPARPPHGSPAFPQFAATSPDLCPTGPPLPCAPCPPLHTALGVHQTGRGHRLRGLPVGELALGGRAGGRQAVGPVGPLCLPAFPQGCHALGCPGGAGSECSPPQRLTPAAL